MMDVVGEVSEDVVGQIESVNGVLKVRVLQ